MKIIGACDSFKESIIAGDALAAIAQGICSVDPTIEFIHCPVADGGEGTIDAITASHHTARQHTLQTTGPVPGQRVGATWAMLESPVKTALIEISSAAGFSLVTRTRRNPMHTTTFGIGPIIRSALTHNPKRLILWLGGSATCDGAVGLAQALGAVFTLTDDRILDETSQPITGADLVNIDHIAPIPPANLRCADGSTPTILAACDVTNPLTGPSGSARVFAPQKGASPADVETLEQGLINLASLCKTIDHTMPRTGSAGGLGFGLAAFLDAQLVSGIDLLLDLVNFDKRIAGADLVITGEGSLDVQTRSGKAVMGVTRRASQLGIPVIAIAGRIDRDSLSPDLTALFHAMYAVADIAQNTEDAIANAGQHLTALARTALDDFLSPR